MSNDSDFKLYGFWRTSSTYRVRVALRLKGLTAAEQIVDLEKGEQLSNSFLAINPLGAVPALVLKGQAPLTQSLAILEFLDEKVPEPPLLPTDLLGRARVRSIASMLACDVHPLVTPRMRKYLTSTGGFDPSLWRAWQIHWFTEGLSAVETRLTSDPETGRFCHGDDPTLADVCLASIVEIMHAFDIKTEATPTIDRIMDNCRTVDAFVLADPFRQSGAPVKSDSAE